MRIVVSGGGTGGHIYPALAIAQELRGAGAEVLFVGAAASREAELAVEYGFSFASVSTAPLHRRSVKIVGDLLANAKGLGEAQKLLADFGAEAAIGTGGFVTAPVLMAAERLHIPTMIHEQNAYPGLANRRLARNAQAVCLTFAAAAEHFPHQQRLHHTGLPVRPAILALADGEKPEAAWAEFSIPAGERDIPNLLITGGSQGAQSINRAAAAAYDTLLEAGFRVIHLCGKNNYFQLRQQAPEHPRLILRPYLEHMEYALALADLAVGRAGASFLAEAAVLGLPLLLVPYPHATNDHQSANAGEFARAKAAQVIRDEELSGSKLARIAAELLGDRERLRQMSEGALSLARPQAAADIAAIGMELARGQ